jgi:hypothetical protein
LGSLHVPDAHPKIWWLVMGRLRILHLSRLDSALARGLRMRRLHRNVGSLCSSALANRPGPSAG